MPDTPPETITVSATEERELAADHADLLVEIRGSALFTGDAALTKAREVAQMVADLRAVGLSDTNIRLQAVHASAAGGTFSRTSTATYTLLVQCPALSQLADVLGAVTSQKNATLKTIIWKYPNAATTEDELLQACLERANQKARRIALGLGVQLLGIRSFQEEDDDIAKVFVRDEFDTGVFERRRSAAPRVTSEELGVAVSHSKQVRLQVTITYLVSRFAPGTVMERQRAPIPELP